MLYYWDGGVTDEEAADHVKKAIPQCPDLAKAVPGLQPDDRHPGHCGVFLFIRSQENQLYKEAMAEGSNHVARLNERLRSFY